MRAFRFAALAVTVLVLSACSPLMRGFQQSELVSDNAPPITIQSTLPLLTKGQCAPFVQVDMTFANPETWLAVYGGETPVAPLAVAAYSVAPNRLQWDFPGVELVDSPVVGEASFGGQAFSSIFRVTSAAKDPFVPQPEANAAEAAPLWLVQRFVSLEDFRKTKIILEYREPMPESLAGMASNIGILMLRPEIQSFAQRAQAAFNVQFAYDGPPIERAPYLGDQAVNQRYLGEFLGGLSPITPYFPNDF